jgi:uncharacterized membrane protein YgcG
LSTYTRHSLLADDIDHKVWKYLLFSADRHITIQQQQQYSSSSSGSGSGGGDGGSSSGSSGGGGSSSSI